MRKERKCKSQRLWQHRECGGKKKKQERASCWILHYSPLFICFMQTQALWLSSYLSSPFVYELVVFWLISLYKHCFHCMKPFEDLTLLKLCWLYWASFLSSFPFSVAIMPFLTFFPLDHWDYHSHPHVHSVEYENLPESNFTELQSVPALHPPGLIRHEPMRYDADSLLDPNLGAHPHVLQPQVSLLSPHKMYIIPYAIRTSSTETHTHWYLNTANNFMHSNQNGNRMKMETNLLFLEKGFYTVTQRLSCNDIDHSLLK